jgi:hypothetical protein
MKFNGLAFSVVAIGLSVLGWTRSARAECTNDIDCPGSACGSQICSWTSNPDGGHECVDAGTGQVGMEGWCSTNADCKCASEGAMCNVPNCTFTLPPAGTGSSGTSATSGASSTSGTSASGTSASGTSASGTSESGTSASGTSTTSSTSSGGCTMAQPEGAAAPWGLGVVALGACLALSRRRRA